MKKLSFDDFSLEDLKSLRKIISNYSDVDSMLGSINDVIEERTDASKVNSKLTLEYMLKHDLFCIETPIIVKRLKELGIKNMDELVNRDIHSLGLNEDLVSKLESDLKFYKPVVKKKKKIK